MKSLLIFLTIVLPLAPIFANVEEGVKGKNEILKSEDLLPTIETFFSLLRNDKVDKAYHSYTSNDFRKATTLEQFKALVKNQKTLFKNHSFQVHSFYSEKGIATFEGALTTAEGDVIEVECDLVQEDGKWKIQGLDLFHSQITNSRP